jgi:molybdenum cofactor cytidylyltransferase
MALCAVLLATARAAWADEPLALVAWDDEHTLVEFHIAQLRGAGVGEIVVVLGHGAERVVPVVLGANAEPIVATGWAEDAALALRVGASALVRGTSAAIVADIAEPRSVALLRALIRASESSDAQVIMPAWRGARGSPPILGDTALALLRNVRGDPGIETIIERFADSVLEVDAEAEEFAIRIDSRDEYERARRHLDV